MEEKSEEVAVFVAWPVVVLEGQEAVVLGLGPLCSSRCSHS